MHKFRDTVIKAGYKKTVTTPNYQLLAGELEISVQSIYNWIRGVKPYPEIKPKLAKKLKITIEELNKILHKDLKEE